MLATYKNINKKLSKNENKVFVLLFLLSLIGIFFYSFYQPLDADEGHYLTTLKYINLFQNINFYTHASATFICFLKIIGFITNDLVKTRFFLALTIPLTLLILFISYKNDKKLINLLFFILIFNSFFISQFTEVKHYAITASLSLFFLFLIGDINTNPKNSNLKIGILFFISTLLILHRYMLGPSVLIILAICCIKKMFIKINKSILMYISGFIGAFLAIFSIFSISNNNPMEIYNLYLADRTLIGYIPTENFQPSNFKDIFTLQNTFLLASLVVGIIFLFLRKSFNKTKKMKNELALNSTIFCISFLVFYIIKSPITDFIHLFSLIGPFSLLCSSIVLYVDSIFVSTFFALIYLILYFMPANLLHNKSFIPMRSDSCGYYYLIRSENIFTQKKYSENRDCYRKIESTYKVSSFLKKIEPYLDKNDEVLSWLTQTVAMTKIKQAVGFEGGVGTNEIIWSDKVNFSNTDAKKLSLLSEEDLIYKLNQNYFKIVIDDPYMEDRFRNILKNKNYKIIFSVGDIENQKYTIWANDSFAEDLEKRNIANLKTPK